MIVVVIGGGAAGFFSAITCASTNKKMQVIIIEKTDKLLSKVRVSGGGRCNVTNACESISEFATNYPRGKEILEESFKIFNNKSTIDWFKKRMVSLKTESDGRIFPITDNSQTIVDCLIDEALKYNIEIRKKCAVTSINKQDGKFHIQVNNESELIADRVIIASGGHPQLQQYDWLKYLSLRIIKPVSSLFTFNIPSSPLNHLMGVAHNAHVSIKNSAYSNTGPLLITHWGISGPVVLKLSSFAARDLEAKKYSFEIEINWADHIKKFTENDLKNIRSLNSKKLVRNVIPFDLPKRLWELFCNQAEVREFENWAELGNKKLLLLFSFIRKYPLTATGKTTFKEEFVTCGGIDLSNINPATFESNTHKGLYFAGEALNIDGITGGFNFQAAWTTGYIAGTNCAQN
jgi:predicted Rossmann fold flavoprotein